MIASSRVPIKDNSGIEVLWEDGERIFCREWRPNGDGKLSKVLVVRLAAEHPTAASLDQLAHEYALRDELDEAWSARPLELVRERDRTLLVLADFGGEPLERLLDAPMKLDRFLRLAIAITAALTQLHRRGLIHKDLKPANILVNAAGEIRLTGFGIASRLSRERQAVDPPETIAGTLAYMAPEQTGRMSRSIDSRSDLYALGVTFYQMLTGTLPFTAGNPTEWLHCHIARQPVAPAERTRGVPDAVSAITLKLLAKTAEERYQTAAGLKNDLQRCLAAWEARGQIEDFVLGQSDAPDRLLIPEKLYGREREVEILLASFDRVARSGTPALVLVSGNSGVGKSALVHEVHKALVPMGGLFASGKFDQHKRDMPYATLAQAFRGLVRGLLAKSDADLASWREPLRESLGPSGQLMVDLVPELQLVIGDQPAAPDASPQDAQRRFQLVVRRFIGVFAKPEHPLALFLDDLQWIDAATLDLLQDMSGRPDLQHLLLIGAYRPDELDSAHPLLRKLKSIGDAGMRINETRLRPLAINDLSQLIADALRCAPEEVAPLAQLVHQKTAGNPFFAIQFLSALDEQGMLTLDCGTARWSWDLDQIHARDYTDNVVELMVGKLTRLSPETRAALEHLACLGNVAATAVLSIILQSSQDRVHTSLRPALDLGLIDRVGDAYKFAHDRVQEAAYSLIPHGRRAEFHLRIGRLLLAQTRREQRDEAIFEIVNQLDRGVPLITAPDEREQLAELNLIAGHRAKASTAYPSALSYFAAGLGLLPEDAWEHRYDLIFALEQHCAECEFVTGALAQAERRLTELSARAANTLDRAKIASLRVDLYTTLGQNARAVAIGLEYLRHLGDYWSLHPREDEARREYEHIRSQLETRTIEDLIELPLMSDPASLATIDILMKIGTPAFFTDQNLWSLVICRTLRLSLDRGNSDGSCLAYIGLGLIATNRFDDNMAAFRFGEIGYHLVERLGLARFAARIYLHFGAHLMPCVRHVREGQDLLRRAFETSIKNGDLIFAGYSCVALMGTLLAAGTALVDVQHEAEKSLEFSRKMGLDAAIDWISPQLGLIRTLRGSTSKFGCLDDEQFSETQIEHHFASSPERAYPEGRYWIRKLQARFFAGDYSGAIEASLRAHRLVKSFPSPVETAEYHFYSALSQAASCTTEASDQQLRLQALAVHHKYLELSAANCPPNFESRAALVGAEMARIEGRDLDAMRLYERAVASARINGFIHLEALANELAFGFYAARGYERIAHVCLRDAYYGYLRWGAEAKVRQLEEIYPDLRERDPVLDATRTIGAPVERLDLATVLKVSEAVSGEILRETLIDTVLRTAIEHAGAERGLLIVPKGPELRIQAQAATAGGSILVDLGEKPISGDEVPESLILYTARTRESVILDDASASSAFARDRYFHRKRARSALCLPLVKQGKTVAFLYLENNLAPRVFTPARIAVLRFIASEAATSLDNARLYQELQERESRIRRLVDANIIGICIFGQREEIVDANSAFLNTVGYDREDLIAGRLNWTDLTPPEWRDRTARAHAELNMVGTARPFEKEYFRKDGTRVPVLIGAAAFNKEHDEGVAFVVDLSEPKRAEAEARESERRYQEAQMELSHANRVAVMGQLTASIAHEVNQPNTAVIASAQAALRWLERDPPGLEQVRNALTRVVENSIRSSEVIERIRELIKKAPPKRDSLPINEIIRNVLDLTRTEAARKGVSVRTAFGERLPVVIGDRVELQQVAVNLILNAIEAMEEMREDERELLIRTARADSDSVLVSIADSGPGLASESAGHLFEPFYTTKPGGLGIGLSICRSIIIAHGGRLWASPNVPRGAIFQFTVPIEDGSRAD
jgi:PAS domain S-box-containing protein